MSGSPGARLVDRVGVEVVPDTSGFVREVEAFLAGVKGRLRVEIPTSLDLDGITRDLEQVKAAAERLKVRIPVEYDEPNAPPRLPPIPPEKVRIDPDSDAFLAKAEADIRAASRALQLSVPLTADGERLRREASVRVRELQAQVQAMSVKVPIDAEMAAGQKAELRAKIAELQAMARTDPVEIPVKVDDKDVHNGLARLKSALANFASGPDISGRAALFSGLGVAAVGAVPGVLTLAGSLVQVGGAALVLPAAMGAATGAIAALVIGTRGFSDALKAMDDPAKFAKALESLAPNARAAAVAVRESVPAWHEMQQAVQNALFDGFAASVRDLTTGLLPDLRSGLVDNASALSGLGREFASAVVQAAQMGQFSEIFGNSASSLRNLRGAITPVVDGLMTMGAAGSVWLPRLTAGAAAAAEKFREWALVNVSNGNFDTWVRNAGVALQQLGSVASSVFSILGSLIQAANNAGGGGLATLQSVLSGIAQTMQSPAFQTGLTAFFQGINQGVAGVMTALPAVGAAFAALGAAIGPLAATLGPVLGQALIAIAGAVQVAAPYVQQLGQIIGGVLGQAIATVGPLLGPLIDQLGQGLVTAVSAAAPIVGQLLQALAPLIPAIGQLLPVLGQLIAAMGPMLSAAITAAVPIIQLVAQAITVVAQALTTFMPQITAAFAGAVAAMQGLGAVISSVVAVISGVLTALVQVLTGDFSGAWTTMVATVTGALSALSAAVSAVLNFIIAGVISFGAAMAASVLSAFTSVASVAVAVWATIQANISAALNMILAAASAAWAALSAATSAAWATIQAVVSAALTLIQSVVSAALSTILAIASAAWAAVQAATSAAWTVIQSVISTALAAIQALVSAAMATIQAVISSAWAVIQSVISAAMSAIQGVISAGWAAIQAAISAAMSAIQALITSAWAVIQSVISSALAAIQAVVSSAWAAIQAATSAAWAAMQQVVSSALTAMQGAVSAGIATVVGLVAALPGQIVSALGNLSGLLVGAGQSLMQGLASGITSAAGSVIAAASSVASSIRNLLPGSPIKEGPLLSWNNGGAGRRLGALLAQGLDASQGEVAKSATRLAGLIDAASATSWPTTFTFEGAPAGRAAGIQVTMTGPVYGPPEEYARAQERRLGDALTLLRIGEVLA